MAPTRRPSDGLLARVNFPLYSVEMLTSRHILVSGGGGSAKTGVANGFEIYELYHNGDRFCAQEVIRHETGSNVVMNCAVSNDGRRSFLVAGQESHCQLYHVNMSVVDGSSDFSTKTKETEDSVRNRRNGRKSSGIEEIPSVTKDNVNPDSKRIEFEIKPGDSIQTDFLGNDPIQRVVRISPNGKIMATGGTDGQIRLWKFPQMLKASELKQHTKEIDDIDFSPDNKSLISIAKDGLAIIWDISTGKQKQKLVWTPPEGCKYLFKRCRYGTIEGQKDKYRMFTLANPFGKAGKAKGYLQQWEPETGELKKAIGIDESLASLAVRDDGRFVAVGTMFSGSVSIYIAFSLQRVLNIPGAHSMFVTGLEFIPQCNIDGPAISSDSEAAVVSISVDNRVCIHNLPYRHALPAWVAIFIIIAMLFLTFMFCSYIGL